MCAQPTLAAEFEIARGINFDQWVTWPANDRWQEDAILTNFPEWQSFVTDEEIARLTKLGFDTIRMPVDVAIFLHDKDEARADKLIASLHNAIERLRAADLKVVVDLHTIPYSAESGAIGASAILDDDFAFVSYLDLITKIAGTLDKYAADEVALELFNEPQYDCTKSDMTKLWMAQVTQMHRVARKANAAITLIVPGGCYASGYGLSQVDPTVFEDDNILWTFHSYEPFILTHQSAGWAGEPVSSFKNLPYPPSMLDVASIQHMPKNNHSFIGPELRGRTRSDAGWYIRNEFENWGSDQALAAKLAEPFETVAAWAKEHKIDHSDIFLGEFGFIAQEYGNDFKIDPQWRIAYLKDMIGLAEKYQFGWAIWSYGGAFGMGQAFGGEPMPGKLLEKLELQKLN